MPKRALVFGGSSCFATQVRLGRRLGYILDPMPTFPCKAKAFVWPRAPCYMQSHRCG